ncbi:MAG: GNAT family protein [Vagococcus sp.]|uniref:GNAT family N-acetyltransferase n=1 Tax=Vagococcus sp. TaxID=1933889 RepID=UPI002FCAF0E5
METNRLFITPATKDDIETIISFEQHPDNRLFIFRGTYEEHLAEIADPLKGLFIIKTKEELKRIGFVLYVLDPESERFELRRIAIDSKNKGYGREVFQRIFELAFEELNVNKVWLDVYHDNEVGIHFYESLGMVREGVLRENHKEERGLLDQIIYSMLKREYEALKK